MEHLKQQILDKSRQISHPNFRFSNFEFHVEINLHISHWPIDYCIVATNCRRIVCNGPWMTWQWVC